MLELTIYGRGGQGGVTLAKLIAEAYFLKGFYVQAFGVYAAERSGAPLQAYVRIDEQEITNHNQITEPDGVIVLDRTLIGERILTGLKREGWLIFNTPQSPLDFSGTFTGRCLATIDATAVAVAHGLGSRTVPIVNTTVFGAAARMLALTFQEAEASLAALKFSDPNVTSCRRAFDTVQIEHMRGEPTILTAPAAPARVAHLLDDGVGAPPGLLTGSWATRHPHRRHLTPPCNHACPAGNDVQAFLAAAASNDFDKAMEVLSETSPFPGVCGRVCPAPCMDACNRATLDENVNVRELERYAADHGHRRVRPQRQRPQRLAVVGSGPAGLSAAYHLARLGYPVTIFEAGDELGGVMRTGIPAYRLPRHVLDRDIDFILDHGVEPRFAHRVSRAELLDLSHEYAAVFVATGLQGSRSLELGNGDGGCADRIVQGIDFLDRARSRKLLLDGERIVVVGGGNTAVDAARTARRLGALSVHMVYRRTRKEMPAIPDEITACEEEGIAIDELVLPVRIRRNGVRMLLTCLRMKLGPPDASGRPSPVPETTDDAYFDLTCDRVVLALGQSPDLAILPEGSEVREDGTLLGLSGAPVFCGGDFAVNEGTVAAAIGSGHNVALHIHRTLSGEDLLPAPQAPIARPDVLTFHVFSRSQRHHGGTIAQALRRRTFCEVHTGLDDDPNHGVAVAEAQRCLSCGVCNACDRCVHYCPDGILHRDEDGYVFDYDYCKGCGVCATACPRGVIYMTEL